MRWLDKLTNSGSHGTSSEVVSTLKLELTQRVLDRLNELATRARAKDLVDLSRRAFMFYDVMQTLVMNDGCTIFVRFPDGKEEPIDMKMFDPL